MAPRTDPSMTFAAAEVAAAAVALHHTDMRVNLPVTAGRVAAPVAVAMSAAGAVETVLMASMVGVANKGPSK